MTSAADGVVASTRVTKVETYAVSVGIAFSVPGNSEEAVMYVDASDGTQRWVAVMGDPASAPSASTSWTYEMQGESGTAFNSSFPFRTEPLSMQNPKVLIAACKNAQSYDPRASKLFGDVCAALQTLLDKAT